MTPHTITVNVKLRVNPNESKEYCLLRAFKYYCLDNGISQREGLVQALKKLVGKRGSKKA
jgi:hypothetical protein